MKTKKCAFCAEEILTEAIKCKHCGELTNQELYTEKVHAVKNYSPDFNLKNDKQKKTFLILASIGAISSFLPWAKVFNLRTVYGVEMAGLYTLVLFLIAIITLVTYNKNRPLNSLGLSAVLIPSILSGIIGIEKIYQFSSLTSGMSDNFFTSMLSGSMSIGIGLYLVTFIGFCIPIYALLKKPSNKE